VLRLGQTSLRVDVVGGRKRPSGGVSPSSSQASYSPSSRSARGRRRGLVLKKKAQHRRDVQRSRSSSPPPAKAKSKPCAAGVVVVQECQDTELDAAHRPAQAAARRSGAPVSPGIVSSPEVHTLAIQIAQFAGKDSESAQTLAGFSTRSPMRT